MIRALLSGLLLSAYPALGQTADYLPLEVGNRWVYECRSAACDSGWPVCGPVGRDEVTRHELVVSEAIPSTSDGETSYVVEGSLVGVLSPGMTAWSDRPDALRIRRTQEEPGRGFWVPVLVSGHRVAGSWVDYPEEQRLWETCLFFITCTREGSQFDPDNRPPGSRWCRPSYIRLGEHVLVDFGPPPHCTSIQIGSPGPEIGYSLSFAPGVGLTSVSAVKCPAYMRGPFLDLLEADVGGVHYEPETATRATTWAQIKGAQ